MKKQFYFLVIMCLMAIMPFFNFAKAQAVDATATITWPFDLGTAGQVATYSTGTADYFSLNYVSIGASMAYFGKNTTYSVNYTQVNPTVQQSSANAAGMVKFAVKPKTGLAFTPTAISFDCVRYGTDGGAIDVIWKSADGTATTLATALKPARNTSGAGTHAVYDLSVLTIPASNGECGLEIYIYSLGATKQNGFANVVITGKVQGTIINIPTYTVATSVSPSVAGAVVSNPFGSVFDQGTEITLTANRNFGYQFSHWANDLDETVSTANPYTFTLSNNVSLKAVYTTINTYSLTVTTEGGANAYMVSALPAGTKVGEQVMYEEGTNVTLTASSNPLLTFNNWATGETSASLPVVMTSNKTVTAVYSAIDYIVGWDFYTAGNNGRVADFKSTIDNESSALILRDANAVIKGWLDKSQVAAGGYEGQPAAVNWNPIADKYYYQISFNAKDFTTIKVTSAMLYNYNAYAKQKCEYSLDGTNFTELGIFDMTAGKVWYNNTFSLPAVADHATVVYIRWIPDYTSAIVGTSSTNDGTAISGIYVTATADIFNDGVAPVVVSTVPAEGATGASASGKIVLTFDEKVKLVDGTTVSMGGKVLTPAVTGKTISFPYTALDYNTNYTFTLAGNTVADLAGNTKTGDIVVNFKTMNRPTVTKKGFDFVVGVDGDFKAALTAAQNASASGNRFYIFFPNGEYNIGANTGDANQMTAISLPNVSYVGESADGVVLYNKNTNEGISITATVYFTSTANNLYVQDLTLRNKDFRSGVASIGRCAALQDYGTKNIYKNVKVQSNQDTYYSGSGRLYFENSSIHGTVDYICGGGDVYFNECLLYLESRSGNCITAPATSSNWGYVFNNCTIDGFAINSGTYRLGRPWSNAPKAVYLNTTMNLLPTAEGWGDPMNVVPSVFAEYNSLTASGATVDLSNRRTIYTKDAVTVTLNPVLTTEQAAQYTVENVLSGANTWLPQLYTEQAAAPVIAANANTITWDDSNYVLCWAVCKNGAFVKFVTTNSYSIPVDEVSGAVYTVRAANEMGGLGAASNQIQYVSTGIDKVTSSAVIVEKQYFTIDGKRLLDNVKMNGLVIVRTVYADGTVSVAKELKNER